MNVPTTQTTETELKNWLALTSQVEVFGPFTLAELRAHVEAGRIPETAQFFQSQTSLEVDREREERASEQGRVVAKLHAEIEAARAEVHQKEGEIRRLREGLSRMAMVEEELGSLRGKLEERASQVAALTADVAEKEDRVCALQSRLEQMGTVAEELVVQKDRAAVLESRVAELEQTNRERMGALEAALREAQEAYGEYAARMEKVLGGGAARGGVAAAPVASVMSVPGVADAEVVVREMHEKSGDLSEGEGHARKVKLEAQAQKELGRLRTLGGKMPGWGRKGTP